MLKIQVDPYMAKCQKFIEMGCFKDKYEIEGEFIYRYLTQTEYDEQMNHPNARWRMPEIDLEAHFDDSYFEQHNKWKQSY